MTGFGAHSPKGQGGTTTTTTTIGWSGCGHDNYRPGIMLDPFADAGTTLACADLAGRDAIGVELNRNIHDLYPRRLAECRRKLYQAPIKSPGQLSLLGA